ncbi:MAG TPA: hypothetical protein PLZ21_07020, partial [Armatimonadota bacterium]|nr:hypothetical protein [Armatimonadota bacterium]
FHMVRSFTTLVMLLSGVVLLATTASAITIASPTEGQIVRDKVRIVIPRSSLPMEVSRSGLICIKVDGRFCAAIDASATATDRKSPVSTSIVYVWDSKAVIKDPNPNIPADQRRYRDGRHEITVEAHGISGDARKESIIESAKVVVNLQNTVQRPNPAPPVNLKYRYYLGQQSIYRVSVTGEILSATGYSLTGGQFPIAGGFDIIQSVEDVLPDGSGLIRYKVDKDSAYTNIFGQLNLLRYSTRFPSVYRIMDSSARVLDANVLSGKVKTEIADCLIRMPGRPVQVGDTWPNEIKMKLEGLSALSNLTGQSTVESFEWEGGFECAKINSRLSGDATFYFPPVNGAPARINAHNIAYFAYKPGKLVKDVTEIEISASMDTATLNTLQQQQQVPSMTSGLYGGGMPSGPASMGTAPPLVTGTGRSTGGYNSGSGTQGSGMTAIKIRLTITKELVRK